MRQRKTESAACRMPFLFSFSLFPCGEYLKCCVGQRFTHPSLFFFALPCRLLLCKIILSFVSLVNCALLVQPYRMPGYLSSIQQPGSGSCAASSAFSPGKLIIMHVHRWGVAALCRANSHRQCDNSDPWRAPFSSIGTQSACNTRTSDAKPA